MSFNLDRSKMSQVILDFPKQFSVGLEAGKKILIDKFQPSNIIIPGMGGSALPGDFLKLSGVLNLPIIVHRDYFLPKKINKHSLIICISYSGNTEEALSAFSEAKRRKLKIVAISSGGKLMDLAKKLKTPFAKIPSGLQPRLALGYQFSALIGVLRKYNLLPFETENEVLFLEKRLNSKKIEKRGKFLAKRILGKIPLVYASLQNWALARIWKINFNENSKVPSFFNVFPELNHNEMVGIGEYKEKSLKEKFFLIILQDRNDYLLIKARMKILSSIFLKKGINNIFIKMQQRNTLEKIFSNLLLSLWTSYFLAIFSGQDPTPVKLVEEFKKMFSHKL